MNIRCAAGNETDAAVPSAFIAYRCKGSACDLLIQFFNFAESMLVVLD